MSKKGLIGLFSLIASITIILIFLGFVFSKSELEKLRGLTDVYDVSEDGAIAYVSYQAEGPIIYLKQDKGKPKLVTQLSADIDVLDISFTPDASSFAYVASNAEIADDLESTVHLVNVQSHESKILFHDPSLITEIKFDPKDEEVLFYLRAGTFENYSPIASARPHNFDIFSYQIDEQERTRYTHLDAYAMSSLQVSEADNHVFIQMYDDGNSQTAEDIFEVTQKVFQVPLDRPDELSVISNLNRSDDIYDFAMTPGEKEMIFQSVSNLDKGDPIFEYELYHYNFAKEQETQLTFIKESSSNPVILANNKVYFLVDLQFGEKYPDYRLYWMDIDGENIKEILLDEPES